MEQPPLFDLPPSPSAPQLVEALLFIAGEPLTVAQLAQALELPADAVEAALEHLAAACAGRGVRVQRHGDQVQLVSAPEASAAIERFLGVQPQARLSPAALEALAIVAYRQPITRAQVDALRGVDSSGVIRALLSRDLIAETGRLETVGRPILYATTDEFLRQFGLSRLADLPPLDLPEPVARPSAESSTPALAAQPLAEAAAGPEARAM
ncbi:MAG TPA: SMC-Scp complex subunit ScpB [Kouleothrix sp.]|uniref:SMC-Scp complex subunit ScpB n=1 Tax=Kouleothrix sp. TaxID=2779161 RepID=UPI002B98CECF|nr:SMC-Scp complex subunit ScpB [Kouleothrix sp.]